MLRKVRVPRILIKRGITIDAIIDLTGLLNLVEGRMILQHLKIN